MSNVIRECLKAADERLKDMSAWKWNYEKAKEIILEEFSKRGVDESKYESWMANNIGDTCILK